MCNVRRVTPHSPLCARVSPDTNPLRLALARRFVALLGFASAATLALAQINYTTAGSPYTQNFNAGFPASSNNIAA